MISYELALKLKESGWPQSPANGQTVYDEFGLKVILPLFPSPKGEWWCVIPTLSELIEACEDDFKSLSYEKSTWHCCGFISDGLGDRIFVGEDYSTPEEAVAKLWLELNKK